MKVKKESEKVDLKLNIQKTKSMTSGPITSWQINGETVADFIFMGSKERKSDTATTFSPSVWHEVIGPDAMIFVF